MKKPKLETPESVSRARRIAIAADAFRAACEDLRLLYEDRAMARLDYRIEQDLFKRRIARAKAERAARAAELRAARSRSSR